MVDGRKQQSEKSMAAILLAATSHFAEKGYEGARVDAIAEEAGVNKAALYYHFGDKSVLYKKVLLSVIGRMADTITVEVQKVGTHEAKLRTLIAILASNVDSNHRFAPMMLREVASGGAALPLEVMQQMGRIFNVLRSILQEGELSGELRSISPFIVHMQIIGGILFFVSSEPVRQHMTSIGLEPIDTLQNESTEQAAEYLADVLLNGLKIK